MTKKTFTDYIKENLYSKNPDMRNIVIADKIMVQEYIEKIIGKSPIFNTRIWAGYSVDEALANIQAPCVIKANNAWRRMKFINSKSDITAKLRDDLKIYMTDVRKSWEWYYQKIKSGLLIEKMLPKEHILYRIYTFGGVARFFFIQRFDVSGNNWKVKTDSWHRANGDFINVTWDNFPNEKHVFPNGLAKKLCDCAEAIAKFPDGVPPYLRVDLYHIENQIIFSELTMLPDAVTGHFNYLRPNDLDYEMGELYRRAVE